MAYGIWCFFYGFFWEILKDFLDFFGFFGFVSNVLVGSTLVKSLGWHRKRSSSIMRLMTHGRKYLFTLRYCEFCEFDGCFRSNLYGGLWILIVYGFQIWCYNCLILTLALTQSIFRTRKEYAIQRFITWRYWTNFKFWECGGLGSRPGPVPWPKKKGFPRINFWAPFGY